MIHVARRVYVSNLAWRTTWQDLKDFMRAAGSVVFAKIMEAGGRSKGCAIVEYETPEEAAAAILNLHDKELHGRLLCVREDREDRDLVGTVGGGGGGRAAAPPPPRQRQRSRSRSPRPPRGVRAPASESAVYVGNLAYTTSADTLRAHAESVAGGAAGAPASVDVPTHADSGRARGYALLSYPTPEAADAAVAALNESECDGRRLLVRRDQGGFVGA